jgi:membrane-bound lytic murein transglycosylase D
MRKTLITIAALLLALPALAAESGRAERALLVALSDAPSAADAGRSRAARSSAEGRLSRELELQSPGVLVMDEPRDEPELQIPEEELPDSDIPLTLNSKVEYFIAYFQTSGHQAFARWLSRSERYIPMMKEVLRKEKLPEDLVYLAMIESGFSPHAYSVAAAVGPWQFMSGTGKRYALRINSWIDERRDPLKSTVAAALYLKELYGLFNNDWYLAAAGYNAGENKILRAIDRYNTRDFWEISQKSYLARETKDYVPKLLAAAIIAKDPARYGFADVAYLPPIEFDTVTIPTRTDLQLAAKLCEVPHETIREFNPELRRWATPPDYPNYQLKIPKGKKETFEAAYAKLPENERYVERVVYARHKVKKRETLASIARRYGTSEEALTELNGLKAGRKLAGRSILIPVKAGDDPPAAKPAAVAKGTTEKGFFNRYYIVRKGDTLRSVARKFNVSSKILAAWNNLKERIALRPGKKIIVARTEKKGSTASAGEG